MPTPFKFVNDVNPLPCLTSARPAPSITATARASLWLSSRTRPPSPPPA